MPEQFRRRFAGVLALLAIVAGWYGISIVLTTDDPDTPGRIVVTVDTNATAGGVQPGTVTAPESVLDASKEGIHEDGRNETPDGVSRADLEAGREQQDKLAANDQLPVVTPLAAPEQAGCRTQLVGNYSTRRGVRPRLFVLHYTVSPNRPGWDDVNAIVGLFDRRAFAASSNYVLDREAHCAYIVRESDKAWTQAAANPVSISVEIINSGHEGSLISGAGREQLIRLIADSIKRWDIPARAGAVDGCTVSRSGVLDHTSLGACGGGHADVNPYRGEIAGIIRDVAKRANAGKITRTDIATCRKLSWWRANGRPAGKPAKNAVRRRRALDSRDVKCTTRGPMRVP